MGLKAFVIEDNAAIRQSLVEALAELAGVETAGTATTEKPAVAWLTDPANAWDIAIVDLILEPGGGSGLGVLKALQGRAAARKMVVLTGTSNREVHATCIALGCDRVFDKSMEIDDLIAYCRAMSATIPAARESPGETRTQAPGTAGTPSRNE